MMINWETGKDGISRATVHDCWLAVTPEGRVWRWSAADRRGHILGTGLEPLRELAKEAAEDDYFACHPVGGPWFEHRCGNCMPQQAATA